MPNEQIQEPPTGSLLCFRWWYKGRTVEGNTINLEGRVMATNGLAACNKVEKQMRAEWPGVRWMQGKDIEGNGVTFGPTVVKTFLWCFCNG